MAGRLAIGLVLAKKETSCYKELHLPKNELSQAILVLI